MKKQTLKERFQQLAGIKPLYEYGSFNTASHRSRARDFSLPKSGPQKQQDPAKILAAAFPTHDDYKDLYIGDDQEFRDMGFEYIEAFTLSPYIFIHWNDEGIQSYKYNSEDEFMLGFREMEYGGCRDEDCDFNRALEVINNSSPDRDSGDGLALLTNGKVTAMGGENPSTIKPQEPQDDSSIAGMEDEVEEGTCGYSIDGKGGDKPAGPHLLKK
jgi:hypothetical protein